MMKKIIPILSLIFIALALFVYAAGEADDMPVVTLLSPAAFSTVQQYDGPDFKDTINLKISASAVIPSGDLDSSFVNMTLWMALATNINDTMWNDTAFFTMLQNETEAVVGISNSTSFTVSVKDGDYITYNVVACNEQNNCSFASANLSAVVDVYYDVTKGSVGVISPLNGTVFGDVNKAYINFSATDNVWVDNVTLWINCSTDDLRGVNYNYSMNDDILYIKNETLTNTGVLAPFDTNTGNTTLTGNFSDFGLSVDDGFCYFYLASRDYNNNYVNDTYYWFEVDTAVPLTSDLVNASKSSTCDTVTLKFNVTEASNISVSYGTNHSLEIGTVSDATFSDDSLEIDITGLNSNTRYYYNLTVCDEHKNCNYTVTSENSFTSGEFLKEFSACAGLNAYGVLKGSEMLKDIAGNISGTNMVSVFAQVTQTFTNYIVGLATNENTTVSRGDAVFVNVTGDSFVTHGGFMTADNTSINDLLVSLKDQVAGNWTVFGALQDWQMGNITEATDLDKVGNVSIVSHYDNADQRYVDRIRGFTWNNVTEIYTGDMIWLLNAGMNGTWIRNETFVSGDYVL